MKSWYKLKATRRDMTYYYDEKLVEELKEVNGRVVRTHKWENYKELYDVTIYRGEIRFLQKPEISNIRFENGTYKIYPAAVSADLEKAIGVLK